MADNANHDDDLDVEGTRYPREEAARLVQASLRQSRFLVLSEGEHASVLRNYGVDYPDTVPIHDIDKGLSIETILQIYNALIRDLRHLLPSGGVICVPPPAHLLCEVCRVGIKEEGLVDKSGKKVCASCYLGSSSPITVTKVSTIEAEVK